MGPFDFLAAHPRYGPEAPVIARLNRRHALVVEPFRGEIAGARVLDLGAHDGRWSYAFAAAGAREVLGVEPRAGLIRGLDHMPDDDARARVRLIEGAAMPALEAMLETGERFEVVAVLGLFYHLMDHFRLLWLLRQLAPDLVILDSEFSLARAPVIELVSERTDKPLNAVAQIGGQVRAIAGRPSGAALEAMAEALAFSVEWVDPDRIGPDREGVRDYFRPRKLRRAVAALRPVAG